MKIKCSTCKNTVTPRCEACDATAAFGRLLPVPRHPEWVSVVQAAHYYAVSKGTIYRWIHEGKFSERVKRRREGGTIVDLAAGPKRQPDNGARNQ